MKSDPISLQDRIISIDIIRGFALFGIFLVNMPAFHSPVFIEQMYGIQREYEGIDFWTHLFFQLFIQAKFFPMFSFLFGLGFFIFISRAKEKGNLSTPLYLRRIGFLFVFGLIHLIFLWFGDILHLYAVTGLFLLLFYNRKPKTILIWSISLFMLYYAFTALQLLLPTSILETFQQTNTQQGKQELLQYVQMYKESHYMDWVTYRLGVEIPVFLFNLPFGLINILPIFLLGLLAGKLNIFNVDSRNIIKKTWITTFILGIPTTALLALFMLSIIDTGIRQQIFIDLLTSINGLILCLFYISSLSLLLRKKKWQNILNPLRYSGQMAFTNYIMQTVICQMIFLVFNLYNEISLFTGTILCILIYMMQITASHFWLKKYRFGPLEWLWRSFTYLTFQPLSKTYKQNKEHSQSNHF